MLRCPTMHSSPPIERWWMGPVESRARRWAEAVFARTRGRVPFPDLGGTLPATVIKVLADLLPTTETGKQMIEHAYSTARARYEDLASRGK
jgi:hypothetical protein